MTSKKPGSHLVAIHSNYTSQHQAFAWASLEPRVMFCATHLGALSAHLIDSRLAIDNPNIHHAKIVAKSESKSGVPILHSLASAPAKIYLDFDGDVTPEWRTYDASKNKWITLKPGTTPAYDLDGDGKFFSTGEKKKIDEIWSRVAEAFSPFNVDVTTQDPGNRDDLKTIHVVIGGIGGWLKDPEILGVSPLPLGAFHEPSPNEIFVFSQSCNDGNPLITAFAAIHETGHALGLEHQSVWDGDVLKDQYNPGTPDLSPFMGNNYYARRSTWWKGPTPTAGVIQEDLTILSGPEDGLGYRPDDYANDDAGGAVLKFGGAAVRGLIEQSDDVDAFTFSTDGGYVEVTSTSWPYGGMLNQKMDLVDEKGKVIRSVGGDDPEKFISLKLAAGTYHVRISSLGKDGSVGQYLVRVGKGEPPPQAPDGLDADPTWDGEMRVHWNDESDNERGFVVERSVDGKTWEKWRVVGANETEVRDIGLGSGTVMYYRVRAYNRTGYSGYSNVSGGENR